MDTCTQRPAGRRWALVFLAASVAVLATILSAAMASAATPGVAETRVRASAVVVEVPVGPPEHIAAGQRLGKAVAGRQIVVATGVAANGVPARFITTGGGVTIDRLAVNTTISAQRQGRHVLGARQYGGGSYFNSADDAQSVLDAFHGGSAQVLGVKGNDIVVRVPSVTGFNVNPGAGFPNQATNVFFIKGSSSPSVVPYNPAWTP